MRPRSVRQWKPNTEVFVTETLLPRYLPYPKNRSKSIFWKTGHMPTRNITGDVAAVVAANFALDVSSLLSLARKWMFTFEPKTCPLYRWSLVLPTYSCLYLTRSAVLLFAIRLYCAGTVARVAGLGYSFPPCTTLEAFRWRASTLLRVCARG